MSFDRSLKIAPSILSADFARLGAEVTVVEYMDAVCPGMDADVQRTFKRILEKQGSISIKDYASYVAGHSLGEYSALTAAGVIGLSDCAKLLKRRGTSMQKAVPVGVGSMAAVLGLDFDVSCRFLTKPSVLI